MIWALCREQGLLPIRANPPKDGDAKPSAFGIARAAGLPGTVARFFCSQRARVALAMPGSKRTG